MSESRAAGSVGAVLGRSQRHTKIAGRYWPAYPVPMGVPRLPDGRVDIRALCRLYDDWFNQGLEGRDGCSMSNST